MFVILILVYLYKNYKEVRFFSVTFISFLLLLPIISNVTLLISFKKNQSIISKTICIEKEIVNNKCQGKCHLAKQLKKITKNQDKESSNIADSEKLELLYTLPIFFDIALYSNIFVRKNPSIFLYRKTKSYSQLIFHPPLFKAI